MNHELISMFILYCIINNISICNWAPFPFLQSYRYLYTVVALLVYTYVTRILEFIIKISLTDDLFTAAVEGQ
jgi:hypothetical protein